jgi:hypothetical protein
MLLDLPCELIHHITSFLSPKERITFRSTHPILRSLLPHYPSLVNSLEAVKLKQELIKIIGTTFLFSLPLTFEYPRINYTHIDYIKNLRIEKIENKLRLDLFSVPIPFLSTLNYFIHAQSNSVEFISSKEIILEPKCMKSFLVELYIEMVCFIHKKDRLRVIRNLIQKINEDQPFEIESLIVQTKKLPLSFHKHLLQEWFKGISCYFLDIKDAIYYLSFI